MSSEAIWWSQIGSQLRLLSTISALLEDERSFVLYLKSSLPWRAYFYKEVDVKRSKFSIDRRLKRLEWNRKYNPGSFVLRNLCPPNIQTNYYPGQTYAEYLGACDDIILCDYYVWITGIRTKMELAAWISFVKEYEAAARMLDRRAIFVLEYDGPACDDCLLPTVIFEKRDYDCRVFCLQLASELGNTDSLSFQSELALSICRSDPELACRLIEAGNALLEEPFETAKRVFSQSRSSEGLPFPTPSDTAIRNGIWRACLILIYPVIEQFRMDFISQHKDKLREFLPINNSNGDVINEPTDLEVGALHYIVSSRSHHLFSQEDADNIRLCRTVRNLLAHNRIPSFTDISGILTLQAEQKAVETNEGR